ncbi:putative nuclease HARBI1 [Harmonia axyridis]|uniref:putative nuclease HARBI1 n=1 Tax=Harmonia axyridis TaxID=115357 RepID=UPI001E2785EA|nr:putative nuclease HARBI1 [Harmonia axyridis]
MEAFKEINEFEGVIGCIDGSHIGILPPREHPNSYVNRKGFHSVLLQGVWDNRKLFTHVYVGEPGSIHDSRLFEKSDLFESIESGEYEFPNNAHILVDSAYKLSDYMMVGFKNNNNLTNRQKNFNAKLSQVRVCIENTFGLLKGRFRRIKFLETVRMDLICLLVFSACLLHNICVLNGDGIDDLIDVNQEVEEERDQNEENEFIFVNTRQNQPAIAKRLRIMSELQID